MFNIDFVNKELKVKGLKVGASESMLNVHTSPLGDGTPHIEIDDERCFYIVSEKGCEFSRTEVSDLDELLFLLLRNIIIKLSAEYTRKNKIPNQDPRRIDFPMRIELFKRLNSQWAIQEEGYLLETLNRSPFDDSL